MKDSILEFHANDLNTFAEIAKDWPLKGATFMHKNPTTKICIVFGQDESMYLLYLLKNFYWSFEDHIAQRNKTEGIGIVVSLLASHEFGQTFNLSG